MIQLTHVHMQALAILGPAGGIVRPHDVAQLRRRDVGAPLHGLEDDSLDPRQAQSFRRNHLAAMRTNLELSGLKSAEGHGRSPFNRSSRSCARSADAGAATCARRLAISLSLWAIMPRSSSNASSHCLCAV